MGGFAVNSQPPTSNFQENQVLGSWELGLGG
jgi:hypothetical protein